MPGAMRLRFSSAAMMRRPVTTGDSARTTCSTSGSSGMTEEFHAKTQREQSTQSKAKFFFAYFAVLAPLREKPLLLICVNDVLDLFLNLIDKLRFTGFDVQAQEWLSVRSTNIEAPLGSLQRISISKIFLPLAVKLLLHLLDHRFDVFD